MSEGGFMKFMSSVQSGISSIQQKATSGSSTFYPSTLSAQKSVKSGWLRKQGGVVKSWHRRWFTVKGDSMYYYSSEDESKAPLGCIFLPGNKVIEIPYNSQEPDRFLFEIIPGEGKNNMSATHLTYPICATSDEERKDWIKVIRKIMFAEKGGAIFGQSLEETMRYEHIRDSSKKVPTIVEMCVDFIRANGLDVEGLFRLPGRSSFVRELRELFDSGERPDFSASQADVHSVASLLKSYLRDLPESIIPPRFYDSVRKIVERDVEQRPNEAFENMYQCLSKIPFHSYNLLQYVCQFLEEVASHAEENKMNATNLSTVFAQSIIMPEEADPAVLMGTATARSKVVFVLISQCKRIFRLEYTQTGNAIHVDNLLDFGNSPQDADSPLSGWYPNVGQSSHLADDLLGLDLSACAKETNGAAAASGSEGGKSEEKAAQFSENSVEDDNDAYQDCMDDYASVKDRDSVRESVSDLDRNSAALKKDPEEEVEQSFEDAPSTPIYDNLPPVPLEDNSPVEASAEPLYARINRDMKARQRSIKNRSARVYCESGEMTKSSPRKEPPMRPPRPPSRRVQAQGSVSSVESLDFTVDQPSAEEEVALDSLISLDVSDMDNSDLKMHVLALCTALSGLRARNTELTGKLRDLRKLHAEKIHGMAQKLDKEKTSTLDAVDRIMQLQGQLQRYQMKYGDP